MTELKRPVRRATGETYRGRKLCFDARALYIVIWEKGRRDRLIVDYSAIYEFALKLRWKKNQQCAKKK